MAEPMKPVKIMGSDKAHGQLISVSLKLQDDEDVRIFRSFLESEPAFKACPKCGKENKVGEDDLVLRVDSPLEYSLMNLATPIMHCDYCGAFIDLNMLDYSPFRSVISFTEQLKAAYRKKKGM